MVRNKTYLLQHFSNMHISYELICRATYSIVISNHFFPWTTPEEVGQSGNYIIMVMIKSLLRNSDHYFK